MLWIFIVGNIHFIELPLGSHTAVLNVSPKNAYFYLRSQCRTARTCCCVSIGCRDLCTLVWGKSKVSEVVWADCCEFLPPLQRWAPLPWPSETAAPSVPGQDSLCNPAEQAEEGGPSPVSTRVPHLPHLYLVQQFIAFQGHSKLRATARILHCYKPLRKATKMNIRSMIMRLNLCWIPSP